MKTCEYGGDVVICRGGCNNKLHHECMKTCEYGGVLLSVGVDVITSYITSV